MSYVDPAGDGTPASGQPVTAKWGDDVQGDVEVEQSEIKALQALVAGRLTSTAQTVVPTATATQIALVETFAVGGMTVSGNTLVVPTTGYYLIGAQLGWETAVTGRYETQLWVAGAQQSTSEFCIGTGAPTGPKPTAPLTDIFYLQAQQTLALYGWQNTGQSIGNTPGSPAETWLSAVLLPT